MHPALTHTQLLLVGNLIVGLGLHMELVDSKMQNMFPLPSASPYQLLHGFHQQEITVNKKQKEKPEIRFLSHLIDEDTTVKFSC